MATQTVEGHGIRAKLPDGWTGRVYREVLQPPEVMGPIMHFANFPVPTDSGFAGQMMSQVTTGRVACVYLEYVADEVIRPGVGLYSAEGFPAPLTLLDFNPATMQVRRDGQAGVQRFFSVGDRPIVLYAVITTGKAAAQAVAELNDALAGFQLASSPEASDLTPVVRQAR